MRNNKLFILVGPSGVGKDAVLEEVVKKIKNIKRFPSFTTRPPRNGEKNGREYFFVTEKEFKKLVKEKKLLEYEQVHPGIFYGTPATEKLKSLLKRHCLIKPIDVLGAQSIKKELKEGVVIIFLMPPSLRELKSRIKKRGELSTKEIKERLGRLEFEMKNAYIADYQVVNDKLQKCVNEVIKIFRKEIKKEG
jgi:guanylate kinase